MKKSMTIERLTEAIRVMESVPSPAFSLNKWMSNCGTVGCTIGHCATDPWFTRRGLRLIRSNSTSPRFPCTKDHSGFWAITNFFGINMGQAERLFLGTRHPYVTGAKGKRSTINAIEKFIRELEAA